MLRKFIEVSRKTLPLSMNYGNFVNPEKQTISNFKFLCNKVALSVSRKYTLLRLVAGKIFNVPVFWYYISTVSNTV